MTISFWIRLRDTKPILATGSYTISRSGPGVLIEYNPDIEILNVEMANTEKIWKASLLVRKHAWLFLSVVWSSEHGLRIILNGKIKSNNTATSFDKNGKSHNIIGRR